MHACVPQTNILVHRSIRLEHSARDARPTISTIKSSNTIKSNKIQEQILHPLLSEGNRLYCYHHWTNRHLWTVVKYTNTQKEGTIPS